MGEIKLVGTAHVSQKSVDEVREAIDTFAPDVVAIELDDERLAALLKKGENPDVDTVIGGGNFSQLLMQWLLAYLQRRIGMDVGIEPGAEMIAALDEAEERGIPVAMADRNIRITFARFWKGMSLWEKIKMGSALVGSVAGVGGEELDIDSLTEGDVVDAAIEEFRRFTPRGAKALIDERDAYLAHSLIALSTRHERVLGVVGAGHRKGIEAYLKNPASLPSRESLIAPPTNLPWAKIIGFGVIALFAFLLVLIGFSGVGLAVLGWALLYWVLINGVLAAGFTLLAGGHPLSALTAFGVSWMTSLNPLLAAGWFAAITEAKVRKPSGADFDAIMKAETFTEMRKIPLFRVVLVAALANVGSTIGTFAYFIFIFPILGIDPTVVLLDGWQNLTAFLGSLI